jgi:hypothetical protein
MHHFRLVSRRRDQVSTVLTINKSLGKRLESFGCGSRLRPSDACSITAVA